jgi:hypothetical protein
MGRHAHVAGATKKRMRTIARMVACISDTKASSTTGIAEFILNRIYTRGSCEFQKS